MIGFQLLLQGTQNGGIQLSTMSLPWLELVSSVSLMLCQSLDGMFLMLCYNYVNLCLVIKK